MWFMHVVTRWNVWIKDTFPEKGAAGLFDCNILLIVVLDVVLMKFYIYMGGTWKDLAGLVSVEMKLYIEIFVV